MALPDDRVHLHTTLTNAALLIWEAAKDLARHPKPDWSAIAERLDIVSADIKCASVAVAIRGLADE